MNFELSPGWSLKMIKELGECITGTTPKTKELEYYLNPEYDFISPSDLGNWKYIYEAGKRVSEKGLKVSRSIPRNTVLCVCIGSSIGKVGLSWNEKSCTNQQINSIICNEDFDAEFIYYLLSYYSDYWKSFSTFSTVPILNKSRFESIEIPVCNAHEEQKKIAYVLSTVQRAIAQQEQLIQTTTELKKALMHKLFTEGLHGEKQKETAIGLVPESWDVVKLGAIARIGNGSTPKRNNSLYWTDGQFPWITSTKIHDEIINEADEFVTSLALKECHLPIVKTDSLLVAITGQGKTLGNAALVTFDTSINQHLAYISLQDVEILPRFLLAFLKTKYEYFRQVSRAGGSTKAALTCGFLKTVLVPKAPLEEQKSISEILENLSKKISLHQRRCDLLADLFRTLLHQLMTAQIRVHDIDLPGFEATVASAMTSDSLK